ncbi:hypothetical protein [Microvirga yunnanensis]|uniref:hypothetical protein n=1 Tax=Microvirga yunnanensis TaxID=2953740 RepID=UPI0021CAD164|nr:hypothetical protein [Microvirga sp. HBU65207]
MRDRDSPGRLAIENSADAGLDGPFIKQAVEGFARKDEILASELALLAAELERQGQPVIAAMLRQASHRYRIASARDRILAMDQGTWPS